MPVLLQINVTVYHMTIVNALIALGFIRQVWTLCVVIGVTMVLAWISTVTVGRLSVKKRRGER